jgi:hypothetical protein
VRIARCGHPATARRGPVGWCDECRPFAELALRLRQAARLARKRGDLPLTAKLVRAIARDPLTYELDPERRAAAARAERETEAAVAAAEAARQPASSRPLPASARPAAGSDEGWIEKTFGPGRGIDIGSRQW